MSNFASALGQSLPGNNGSEMLFNAKRSFGQIDSYQHPTSNKFPRVADMDKLFSSPHPGSLPFHNASTVSAGMSSQSNMSNRKIANSIIIQPSSQGWHKNLMHGSAMFLNRAQTANSSSDGIYGVVDLPQLNYYLEMASMAAADDLFKSQSTAKRMQSVSRRLRPYLTSTVQEYQENYNYLGHMCSLGDVTGYSAVHNSAANVCIATTNYGGRIEAANVFGRNLREGDPLYFVTRKYPMDPEYEFLDPEGCPVQGGRTGPSMDTLQCRGFTDRETTFAPNISTCIDATRILTGTVTTRSTKVTDVCYYDNLHKSACEYRVLKDVAQDGTPIFRDLVNEEGIQEQIDAIPDLIFPSFENGHPDFVGIVREVPNHTISQDTINLAHRSRQAMKDAGIIIISRPQKFT